VKTQTFELRGEFIALGSLIKALGIAGSGGEAKVQVKDGAVRVNGEVDTRRRRKIRAGDIVTIGALEVQVQAGTAESSAG